MTLKTYQCQLAPHGQAIDAARLEEVVRNVAAMKAQLVLIFGDVRHFEAAAAPDTAEASAVLRSLQARLSDQSPITCVVGCSTAGEIMGDKVTEGTLTLTALALDRARVQLVTMPLNRMEDSQSVGQALSAELRARCGSTLRQIWVLAPGVAINGSALVQGLKDGFAGTDLPDISGGLAGDGGAFKQTWTLGPQGIGNRHIVAIGLAGDIGLKTGSHAQGGWEAFGPARRITRAQGNVLFEMDRESALSIYRRYLGGYAKDLPASGLLFPLQITRGPDQGLIRTILGINEEQGSLILAGDVSVDSHVRLMHASPHHLVAAAEEAARHIQPSIACQGTGLALLVSCVGRRIVMGDQVEEEVEAVADTLPSGTCITGFYSNGEIAAWNFAGDCRLHNQTMTISWLAEATAALP